MKKRIIVILIIVLILIGTIMCLFSKNKKTKEKPKEKPQIVNKTDDYNINLLKTVNSTHKDNNYLISPYSIEVALNMLKSGAEGNTYKEIDQVIKDRKINDVSNKDIGIANALFIKNDYKKSINKDFYNTLVNKYNSEVLYDEFKTPKVINDWVNEKTNKMIPEILNKMDSNFVLGLANALAIDVKWVSSFECEKTRKEEFESNGKNIKVEMMHDNYRYESDTKYFETENAKGIILPYQENDNIQLEFVGILPNKEINDYINSLTTEELSNIDNNITQTSEDVEINLSLPRFSYDFSLDDFQEVLKTLGIKDAFDKNKANFSKMISNENIYVGTAVHKTKIDLNEVGTKAAAVTYFGMKASGMFQEAKTTIDIKFNKPFIYLIREKNTKELLFLGVVYDPNIWQGSTCNE